MRSRIRSVLQVTLRADINTSVTCVLKDLPIHFHTHIISSMAGHCWKAQESDFEESSVIPQSFKLKQGRKKKKKKEHKVLVSELVGIQHQHHLLWCYKESQPQSAPGAFSGLVLTQSSGGVPSVAVPQTGHGYSLPQGHFLINYKNNGEALSGSRKSSCCQRRPTTNMQLGVLANQLLAQTKWGL